MDGFNRSPVKIDSDDLFAKFLDKNKKKIPKDVRVERVESRQHHDLQNNSDEGTLVVHAFTLSLGLYLPLDGFISEMLSNLGNLGVNPIHLVPNCWRIMFSIVALNQYFCKTKLGWKEFCYCYSMKVKKNEGGLCYFSRRKKDHVLVKNLPDSDKGWQDLYISLKGNWGGYTRGKPADYSFTKPRDCEVNLKDLEKAWSFGNKDWRYLLDPANWRNDGAAVAASSLLIQPREEVASKEVIIDSLQDTENEVVEQPGLGGETGLLDDQMTTNVSKKQRTSHDSGSGGVAHDDTGQEAAGDLFKETMNTSPPSLFSDGVFHHLEKAIGKLPVDDETGSGLARSLTEVLKSFAASLDSRDKIIKELGVKIAEFAASQDSKNTTINQLEAEVERLKRELADSKSARCEEVVGALTEHGKSPAAEQFEDELAESKSAEPVGAVTDGKSPTAEQFEDELAESKSAEPVGAVTEHGKSPTPEQMESRPKVVEETWSFEGLLELGNSTDPLTYGLPDWTDPPTYESPDSFICLRSAWNDQHSVEDISSGPRTEVSY